MHNIIGSRSSGRSILAATDTMFIEGRTNQVRMKEKMAATMAHTTVAGIPTAAAHQWYTPILV